MNERTARLVVIAVVVVAFVAGVVRGTLSGGSGATQATHYGSTMDGGGMP